MSAQVEWKGTSDAYDDQKSRSLLQRRTVCFRDARDRLRENEWPLNLL